MAIIDQTTTVTSGELAIILGVTRSWISKLTSDKVLIRTNIKGTNYYPLAESVQRYIEYKSTSVNPDDKMAVDMRKAKADAVYKENKAEIMRLEAEELKGKMHRSEDVEAMTSDLIYNMRSVMIALPGRLALDVAEVSNPAECAQIIRREIFSAMATLSEYRYDPAKYAERVRDRRKWEAVMLAEEQQKPSED